jgi:menaquinone-dependent protoporphyrinogen oxidase
MQRPVAVFALGPIGTDAKEIQGSRAQLDQELVKHPWLTPVALEMFVGRYDPARLRFPDNLLARLPASPLHQMPASDHRDWAAIRDWANNLPQSFIQKTIRA